MWDILSGFYKDYKGTKYPTKKIQGHEVRFTFTMLISFSTNFFIEVY